MRQFEIQSSAAGLHLCYLGSPRLQPGVECLEFLVNTFLPCQGICSTLGQSGPLPAFFAFYGGRGDAVSTLFGQDGKNASSSLSPLPHDFDLGKYLHIDCIAFIQKE